MSRRFEIRGEISKCLIFKSNDLKEIFKKLKKENITNGIVYEYVNGRPFKCIHSVDILYNFHYNNIPKTLYQMAKKIKKNPGHTKDYGKNKYEKEANKNLRQLCQNPNAQFFGL